MQMELEVHIHPRVISFEHPKGAARVPEREIAPGDIRRVMQRGMKRVRERECVREQRIGGSSIAATKSEADRPSGGTQAAETARLAGPYRSSAPATSPGGSNQPAKKR